MSKGGSRSAAMNLLLVLRSALMLLGAVLSLVDVNAWVTVMIGPDCWDYSATELGVDAVAITVDSAGYQRGVDAGALKVPLAQALRYAVSGVGVHLFFIGVVVLYLGLTTSKGSRLHMQVPLAMLLLDALTLLNATGMIDPNTAGHPRCATVSAYECAGALKTFIPVVVLDVLTMLLAVTSIYPGKAKAM